MLYLDWSKLYAAFYRRANAEGASPDERAAPSNRDLLKVFAEEIAKPYEEDPGFFLTNEDFAKLNEGLGDRAYRFPEKREAGGAGV